MKKICFVLAVFVLLIVACNRKDVHPIIGKWKLAQAGDSVVIDNPYEIIMEFSEDGKVTNQVGSEGKVEGTYLLSDDTTQLTILEKGKVMTEMKILQLDKDVMIFAEGKEKVKFVKLKE